MIAEVYDLGQPRAIAWDIEPKQLILQATVILIVIGLFFIIWKKKKSK
jgi:uncharacterized membrane protein YqjE